MKSENKTKITPLGDRVLVKPFTEEDLRKAKSSKVSFGIILPESISEEKSAQGKVLAVGEGKFKDGKIIPVRVKVGDIVFFSKYGYDEINTDGDDLYLLKKKTF